MFTRLRPLFALFVRSLREQARAKFTPLARGAIALIILLFIAGNESQFTNHSAPGQSVLMLLVMVNFFAIAVFGLSTFASAITEEKEEDTLGLLQMTRLNPLAILLGKSTARLCEGLLLLAVQVPFTMLCITLGGVSMEQVLRCYAILAAFLFFLCNVALVWSVVCRRTSRATWMTTLTGIVLYLLLLSIGLASRFSGPPTQTWSQSFSQWCISINPVFDLVRTVEPRSGIFFPANSIMPSLIGGVICFGLAWMLFAPCCNSGAEAVPQRTEKVTASAKLRRTAHSRPGHHAIAWKDFHFLSGGWRGLLIRSVVYGLIALLFVWWMATISRSSVRAASLGGMFWVFGQMSFSIEIGLVSARIFGVERKHKTLGTLYTLPLGTGRLVREKILGALPQLVPSVALTLLGIALVIIGSDGRNWRLSEGFIAGCILALSAYVFFAVFVTYLSLRMRRAPLATGLCVMFGIWITFGSFMPMHGRDFTATMLANSVLAWIAIIAIAARIPHRIAIAAAAE